MVSVRKFLTAVEISTTSPTTIPTFDACVSAITSPDGEIPLTVREEEEGSDLHVVTVSLALVQLHHQHVT